jgi:hypothetical protein
MNFLRRNIYELIQRETPGDPGGGQSGDPPEPSAPLTPDQLRAENARLRRESGGYRLRNKGELAAAARKLSGVLGSPVADDQDPPDINNLIDQLDPGKHTAALKAKDDTIRSERLGRVLAENFHALNLKPKLARGVLVSEGHMERLQADVDKADFEEIVKTTLEELAETMPEVRGSGPIPTRTSAPFGPSAPREQFGLDDVNAMTPEDVASALKQGKLDELLGRRY